MEENQKNLSSTGLDEKTAALLAYVLGWLGGIIFIIVEKKSKFVRFHAWQSTIAFGALTALWIVFMPLLVAVPFLSMFISNLLWLAAIILLIILAIKAYQGEEYMLPIIGKIAKKQAEKPVSQPSQAQPENKQEEPAKQEPESQESQQSQENTQESSQENQNQ